MAPTISAWLTTLGADVLAFAAEQRLTKFLHPMLEMTRRVFPDAQRIEVCLVDDPELPDDQHVVFEVEIEPTELTQTVDRHWQWSRELFQVCPATHACLFGLHVTPARA